MGMTLNTPPRAKPKPTPKAKSKKRKKKTPRQLIIIDLDNIIREIVFMRDENSAPLVYKEAIDAQGAVEYAINHRGVPQPGHVISRGKMSVRWDLWNVHKQDASDNLLHEFYPEVYNQWVITKFGLNVWNRLVDESRRVWIYSMDDLETLYIELVEIKKKQEDNPSWKPYFSQKEIVTGEWRTISEHNPNFEAKL
jgi:hypothetical protein